MVTNAEEVREMVEDLQPSHRLVEIALVGLVIPSRGGDQRIRGNFLVLEVEFDSYVCAPKTQHTDCGKACRGVV